MWRACSCPVKISRLGLAYREAGRPFHRRILLGDPAREILRAIKEEGVDVVVMATKGRRGHFEVGSVTEKIVKSSPVPVWTVRPIERAKGVEKAA